jgi:hypothetical protein
VSDLLYSIGELIVIVVAAAILARLTRRYLSHEMLIEQNGALQVYITIVAATYGILVALVFVAQVNNHDAVTTLLSHESADMAFMFRIAESLPDPAAKLALQRAVRDATESDVDVEWPMMLARNADPAILHNPKHAEMWRAITSLDFNDPKTKALADEAMRTYRTISDDRRQRLLHAQDAIAPVTWLVLMVGGLIFVAHAFLIGVRNEWYHMTMTAMSVGLIFLLLRLIYLHQHPYEGAFAATPEPYRFVLRSMNEALAAR